MDFKVNSTLSKVIYKYNISITPASAHYIAIFRGAVLHDPLSEIAPVPHVEIQNQINLPSLSYEENNKLWDLAEKECISRFHSEFGDKKA